jgi:hypothetical protein
VSATTSYRVDFRIVKDIHGRPRRRNNQAFTFTIANSQAEAEENVHRGHPGEQLEIISAEVER